MEKGILVAGSAFVDHIKFISDYPQKGMLAQITSAERLVGGLVSNTGISLKKIEPTLRVEAFAGIGIDEDGEFLKKTLSEYGIGINHLINFQDESTGFTDAMIVEGTGERTFFSYEGANGVLSKKDFNIEEMDFSIVHFGYLLLMKQFDLKNDRFGTELAEVLYRLQKCGVKTSIDIVSKRVTDFKSVVLPALKYCNYVIINEIEAELITDISPYFGEEINEDSIREIMNKIFLMGVQDLVVIHAPSGGWAMTSSGELFNQSSYSLPKGFIKSSVGAGDAFCAGILYGIYHNYDINYMLKFANAVAAMSLSEKDSVTGVREKSEVEKFIIKYAKEERNVS